MCISSAKRTISSGIRLETLCRIETGKHTPSVPTIDRVDRAIKKALAKKNMGK